MSQEKRFHRYIGNCHLFHHLPVLGGPKSVTNFQQVEMVAGSLLLYDV